MKKIYFLCTGNACRSQMAEGFAKKYLTDSTFVRSAGIEAHGLNSTAVEIMKEVGIDISKQKSEIVNVEDLKTADIIITLCGDADENCPSTPQNIRREHWGIEDPAKAKGSKADILQKFRAVRAEIEKNVQHLKDSL